MRAARLVALALLAAPAAFGQTPEPQSREVKLADYTPLAGNLGLADRLLTPLSAAALPGRLAAMGKALRDQPIDLAAETFRVYVPRQAPAGGYGLLVFIAPWDDDHLPAGWGAVLDARGVIFVSAAHSGNDTVPIARRIPLAILAAYNAMRLYAVNPRRVYVSGFSGGSRVALRAALGYPDLFHGAFLDAGADPIGEADAPLPSAALFDQFITTSRIAYFSGASDEINLDAANASAASLGRWCMHNTSFRVEARMGHDIAPSSGLDWALGELDKPVPPPSPAAQACRTRLSATVQAELDQVRAAQARGDTAEALRRLRQLDRRFAGLAAPQSVALAKALEPRNPADDASPKPR